MLLQKSVFAYICLLLQPGTSLSPLLNVACHSTLTWIKMQNSLKGRYFSSFSPIVYLLLLIEGNKSSWRYIPALGSTPIGTPAICWYYWGGGDREGLAVKLSNTHGMLSTLETAKLPCCTSCHSPRAISSHTPMLHNLWLRSLNNLLKISWL